MKIYLFILMLFIGVILTLHLTMNAQVGVIVKNSKMGNAIFWTIGAITALLIGATAWDASVFTRLKDVPVWLLTAGAMGACFGVWYCLGDSSNWRRACFCIDDRRPGFYGNGLFSLWNFGISDRACIVYKNHRCLASDERGKHYNIC